jgi:hypothetical protein
MPVIPFNHNLIKISKRQYRNPIYLAREWRKAIDKGKYASPATLARQLRISRARVTQVLNLLELSPDVIELITSLGDPMKSPIITERRLRPLVSMSADEQIEQVKIMLSMQMYRTS